MIKGYERILVVVCYECTYVEKCITCDYPHEYEGVKYDCAKYAKSYEELASMMIDPYCPVCGSHRVEVVG
jgi:Zn finger protein HypA/HybF involved in hydrogenase expression